MDAKQTDKLLVKISRGDNAAFAELYDKTKRGVFSFLYSYLKNYEDAEDAMQTVYLKIKCNIMRYAHGTNGGAWMLQIAKNEALNRLNSQKRFVPLDDHPPGAVSPPSSEGITELMQKILTDEEQRVVVLHVLWGYKHREIARMLGCPTGTVTSKYKRSVAKLKEAFKEGRE